MKYFFALADAAMLRASCRVAAENKRRGLPMIVTKSKAAVSKRKASSRTR